MRTTIIISDEISSRARSLSGIERITDLVHAGLNALIERETRKRLVQLAGSDKLAWAPSRNRDLNVAEASPPYRA